MKMGIFHKKISKSVGQGVFLTLLTALLLSFVLINDKTTVVCVGDSITFGAGVYKTRDKEAYPVYLQELLGNDYKVINCGRSGTCARHASNNPYVNCEQYLTSKAMKGDCYIIMLGANDTKLYNWDATGYEEDLEALVQEYIDIAGNENVYLLKPMKAYRQKKTGEIIYGINDEIIYNEVGPIVGKVAKKLDVKCIDMYNFSINHPEYYKDGVHPNAIGNKKMAKYIYDSIKISR